MNETAIAAEPLMTPEEVGSLFRVDPRTVKQWAVRGWPAAVRTPGGQWRFRPDLVRAALGGQPG